MENKFTRKTKMLNYEADSIRKLIENRKWKELDEYQKIGTIYDFVRNEILFGYNRSDILSAEEILDDGYGQCNTKATLLMTLFRACGISCRLHGTEVSKCFQRGATSGIISILAPATVIHTWVEVLYEDKWIALEGVITDEAYLKAIKEKYKEINGPFAKYAISVTNLKNLDLSWTGKDTFVQNQSVVKDYGVFEDPDSFFEKHPQTWNKLKDFAYVHFGRKVMNRNVARIRVNRNKTGNS